MATERNQVGAGVQPDVVIAGAGPAGLCAAIVFAMRGFNVVIADPRPSPHDKACGEGIMPTGWNVLETLGVTAYIDRNAAALIAGIEYISSDGTRALGHFEAERARGIRRTVLSAALFKRVLDFPNIRIIDGCKVEPMSADASRIEVAIGGENMACALLIGADGLHSPVRRWAGLLTVSEREQGFRKHASSKDIGRGSKGRWGIRRHYHVDFVRDVVEVFWGPRCEAYVTPVDAHTVGLAILFSAKGVAGAENEGPVFERLLSNFPSLEARFRNLSPCSAVRASGPLRQRVRSQVADGVALVGDAGGYLDAITGEGLSLAFEQALLMDAYIVPRLREAIKNHRIVTAREMAGYVQALRRERRMHDWITRLALFLSRYPVLARASIRLLSRSPRIFSFFLSVNMGRARFYERYLRACR